MVVVWGPLDIGAGEDYVSSSPQSHLSEFAAPIRYRNAAQLQCPVLMRIRKVICRRLRLDFLVNHGFASGVCCMLCAYQVPRRAVSLVQYSFQLF